MTIKDYDKKPKFDPNKPFEAVEDKPKFDPNKPFEEVKKKESGSSPLQSSGEDFPLLYQRDKKQMAADMRPSGIVPLEINQEQERQFNRLKRGFEDTTSPVVPKPIAETVRQTVPKAIKDGVIKDKTKDEGALGYIFNTVVDGVAELVAGIPNVVNPITDGAEDLFDKAMGIPGFHKSLRDNNIVVSPMSMPRGDQLRKDIQGLLHVGTTYKAPEFDVTNGVQASDIESMAVQAPRQLLDMAYGAMTGGSSFFLQSVSQNAKELAENPEADKLTPTERMGYLYTQGIVQAALEKFSLNKILKSTGLSQKASQTITKEIIDEFSEKGIKATTQEIQDLAVKKASSLSAKLKKFGTKVGTSAGVESVTEGLQTASSEGNKLLWNKISGNEIFDEADITKNFLKDVINSSVQGGAFGGVVGGGVGALQNTNKAIREQVAKAQTPADLEKIRIDIAEQVELGNITKEEADAANITADQYAKVAAKIPTGIDAEQKYAIIGGIEQREGIKKEIEKIKKGNENLDPAFHESSRATLELLEAKLEQTNDYLEGVIAGKKPTYRKEKPTTEGGEEKYYKTSPSGEETKITKEHYDLATAVREEQAIKNKEAKEASPTPMQDQSGGTAEIDVVPSTSVIMPGEIQRPETTTIAPKENVPEEKANISIILPKSESKETTSEIPITTEETKPINAEPNKEGEGAGGEPPKEVATSGGIFMERPATELSFRGLQNVANEFGYEDVKPRDRVSDIKEKQNARETALDWAEKGQYEKNVNQLLSSIENRETVPTAKQRLILQDYLANESQKLRDLKGDKEAYDAQFEKVKRIKQIGQIARQEAGAALRIGGERSHPVADYADAVITMAEAIGEKSLNEKQQAEVDALVKNYEQKAKDAEAKVTELEAKLSEMEAAKEVAKAASVKKTTKKTAEQYKDERAKFREELKAAKAEHDKWLKEQGISKMGVGLTLTPKMIKAISKIAGSHIEEIGNNIKEVTKRVFDEVKDYFDDITETDVHDIISGKYGDDYNKLFNVKQQIEKSTIDLKSKTASKDFEKQEKITWAKNKELKAKYPKLYKETLDALAAKEDAKLDYDKALAKEELAKLKGRKKIGFFARGAISTSKAIASGIDFSGIMMQNLVAMVAHPRSAVKALPSSFKDFASDKSFTRWLTELHNSKEWSDIENSGLSITDPKSLKEAGKEEAFSGNLLDREIKIKGKKYQLSKYMTKPFERQFTSLGNRMRVNMFLRITDRWKEQGKTFETDPESYKSLARVLNTETGRGGVPEAIEKAHGIVNSIIWSPKLMASRLNILGISDVGALVGGKGYYTDLTPEVRRMALLDLVKFIGAGTALMGFAASLGAETDDDPRSPKFGTIKIGDKSYNAWGGFTPYVKTIYQSAKGERLSAGQERPTTTGELLMKFARSKMTPFAGAVTSAAYKKDYSGKPTTIGDEALKSITPLSIKGILEGLERDGTLGIIKQGIPSIIGIGVTDQRDFTQKPDTKKDSKSKRTNQRKQTKQD